MGSLASAGGSTSMGSTPSATAAPPSLSVLCLHFCLGSITQLTMVPRRHGQLSSQDLLRPVMVGNSWRAWEISEWWARCRGFYRPQAKAGGQNPQ